MDLLTQLMRASLSLSVSVSVQKTLCLSGRDKDLIKMQWISSARHTSHTSYSTERTSDFNVIKTVGTDAERLLRVLKET